jgi:hypothetical protein
MASISAQVLSLFENLNKRQLELENTVTQLKNVIILSTQQELAAEIRNGVKELEKWIEVRIKVFYLNLLCTYICI